MAKDTEQNLILQSSAKENKLQTTNAVNNPIESYPKEKQNLIRSFLNAVDKNLKSFVERVKNGSKTFERFTISKVSEREVEDIRDLLNIDVSGYTHNINSDSVKHILNRHGVDGQHDSTMSMDDDIARLGWVMENYDTLEVLTEDEKLVHSIGFVDNKNNPAPQIRYSKKINGTYYVVEAAFENKHNKLWVQSAYLNEQKEEVVTQASDESDDTNHEDNVQNALASPTSNINVSQDDSVVNENLERDDESESVENIDEVSDLEEDFEFTEPEAKDITRPPSQEELLAAAVTGKVKTAAQNHVLDIAKKLDPDLKVEFVDDLKTKGKFLRGSNRLLIRADLSAAQMYVEIFKHEFMHRLETRRLYDSYLHYCFKKSKAFVQYAKASYLALKGESYQGGNVINALVGEYYNNYKTDTNIPAAEREAFTWKDAQREVLADFFADVLFRGKAYRQQIAESLKNSDVITAGDIDSTIDALTELAQTDRGLCQKIKDFISECINWLKGEARHRTLVQDLEYLEKRLEWVYQSADSKKALQKKQGEVKNAIDKNHNDGLNSKLRYKQFPPYNESQSDANEWATRWAQSEDVQPGEQKLASYHNRWYLIEKFNDVEFGYRVMEFVTKRKYEYYKGVFGDVRDWDRPSVVSATGAIDSSNGADNRFSGGNRSFDYVSNGYTRENTEVFGLGKRKREGNRIWTDDSVLYRTGGQRNSKGLGNPQNEVNDEADSTESASFMPDNEPGQNSLGSPMQQLRYNPEVFAKHLNRRFNSQADPESLAQKLRKIVVEDNKSQKAQEETRRAVYDMDGNKVGELTLKERLINDVAVELAENVSAPLTEDAQKTVSMICSLPRRQKQSTGLFSSAIIISISYSVLRC